MKKFIMLTLTIALLGGCANRVVEKPVYIPIPSDLLADCRKTDIKGNTVGDLARAYNARGVDIDVCNVDKKALREREAELAKKFN